MTVYPFGIDSDATIVRVDDNITEIGGDAINQLRAAMFAVETELGIQPAGSAGSVANRLGKSLNQDGSIKASALTSIGLATLPIVDAHVAPNAGIKEYKLALDYSTTDLHTLILANSTLLNSLIGFSNTIFSDLNAHIAGAQLLSNGFKARHVLSHIDINSTPSDTRDPSFTWSGLKDKNGILRTAVQAAQALDQINSDLIAHETTGINAHTANAIVVNTDSLKEIPEEATTVQAVIEYLDQAEVLNIGLHRATQHSNGIPRTARSQSLQLDGYGYGQNVVPSTPVKTFLVHAPNTTPVDDLSFGDDIIKFTPINNSTFIFDSYFNQVRIGDILTINYGNSIQTSFLIDSIRYTPGAEWIVRINGINLFDSDGYATARIDRPQFNRDTAGVLAVAAANPTPTGSFSNILASLIVGHPRGAMALGLGFDPGKLDNSHYQLHLELYPTGNPIDHIIKLPPIDVTGNSGTTPGLYTLESIIHETNKSFRKIGFNFRFIAFEFEGEFGIMLADAISNASFAIINGSNTSGTLTIGGYTKNVIGGDTLDDFDVFGFGSGAANIASPAFQTTFADATAAQLPTKVIIPLKHRNYVVNGFRLDNFALTYLAIGDGYWPATLTVRNPIGAFTVEVTYTVDFDLCAAGLKIGKTLVVQPTLSLNDPKFNDVDYGRFIIKSINFSEPCGNVGAQTHITVINGLHAAGAGFGFSTEPNLPVKLYFSADSVGFDAEQIIDSGPTTLQYNRLHEIYITQQGKTFSHERARMPRQLEDAQTQWLGTSKWHIKSVSPKLRGYRDSNASTFNKFIRLYILSYNNVSGEFTGYLGQRISAISTSIQRTGPIVTGRKNIPVKFYDETGVDFIELSYEENNVFPGTAILSTAQARFVDVELFSSLELDNELLLLSTCEVNWNPASNKDVIEHIRNTRQFGSISETDFTNSALDFISAADSYLHENGIIRGLDFDSINPLDNRELYFKGGVAIVNGKIVTINNSSVVIPRVYPFGTSLPQIVTWAVCVNQFNELTPIIITNTKSHFFATTTGSDSYYLPSVTFSELVLTRKDLTPIALVTAHIASFTISNSDIKDVRRFVINENHNQYLFLSSDESYGHFHSLDVIATWINNFNSLNNKVIVRGNFTFSASIDLSSINNKLILEGDGANFIFNCPKGIILGSNVSLNNINFTYVPGSLSFTSNDIINSGNGCIYSSGINNLIDITIEDCIFNYLDNTLLSQRPPFINLELHSNEVVNNLKIRHNKFVDISNTSMGRRQAAIAMIFTNDGGNSNPVLILNSDIEDNVCNYNQGIYITSVLSSGGVVPRPGINCSNVHISNNICGTIGFITSSVASTNVVFTNNYIPLGLTINGNSCHYIASLYANGQHIATLTPPFSYGFGNVIVENNSCNWIHVVSQDSTINNESSALIITRNNLQGYDNTYLANFVGGAINFNYAILTFAYPNTDDVSTCRIIDNNINYGRFNNITYLYTGGMWALGSALIRGNIIKGFARVNPNNFIDGIGIIAKSFATGNGNRNYLITNNEIYRESNLINAYISSDIAELGNAVVSNNFFDKPTTNGTDSLLAIFPVPSTWIVDSNINHSTFLEVKGWSGTLTIDDFVLSGTTIDSTIEASDALNTPTNRTVKFSYNDTVDTLYGRWRLALNDILPNNVQIISANVKINSNATPSDTGQAHLRIKNSINSEEIAVLVDGTDHNLVLNTINVFRNSSTNPVFIEVEVKIKSNFQLEIYIDNLFITYRW